MDATAQEIVTIARSEMGRRGAAALAAKVAATGVRKACFSNAAAIAEAVMGRDAWDTYKNSEYKSMKGPRAPEGSAATKKRVTVRNKKMGGSMVDWSLQHEPERFAGQDTLWNMDHTLTWLPPNGDETEVHVETLGNMISEAFHQHKIAVGNKKRHDAKKEGEKSSTAAEASELGGATSVHGTDFFKTKK